MNWDSRDAAINKHHGFSFVELLVVIAVIALLCATLIPAIALSRPDARTFQCLNNNRQLTMAWRMYSQDNHEILVYSSDDGNTANFSNDYAWTKTHLDYSPSNVGNWDTNVDIVKGPLFPYTGRNPAIYRCPSDAGRVVVSGVAKPFVRSVSMNFFLGGFAGTTGGYPVVDSYLLFLKTTDLIAPGPAKTFVFLEMREDEINWGNFITAMIGYSPSTPTQYQFIDYPGIRHDSSANISFADGHCITKRWLDPRTVPALSSLVVFDGGNVPSPRNTDIGWLQDHSTRPK